MIYTLSDARNKVAPYVQSGTNNTTLLDSRINDALERLLDGNDWECLKRPIRIVARGNTFALPYNAEKILWCDIDSTPARIYGQGYQYLSSGVGDLDYRNKGHGTKDLVDLGDQWPIAYEIPRAYDVDTSTRWDTGEMYLAAFAGDARDVNRTIDIFGSGVDGLDNTGESISIQSWGAITEGTWDASFSKSASLYAHVSRVVKPVTAGYVSLYAVDTVNETMFLVAKYHPTQILPQFRRYRLTNSLVATTGVQSAVATHNTQVDLEYDSTVTSGTESSILAIVRLRHVTLSDPGDIVPVSSMQALVFAVRAVNAEHEKDFALAETLFDKATGILGRREEANTMTKGTPVVVDTIYNLSAGRKMNRGILL